MPGNSGTILLVEDEALIAQTEACALETEGGEPTRRRLAYMQVTQWIGAEWERGQGYLPEA